MAKQVKCPHTGRPAYRTKAEAEKAAGKPAKRCGRCRQWHPDENRGRRS